MIVKYFHNSFDREGYPLHNYNIVSMCPDWNSKSSDEGHNYIYVAGPFDNNIDAFLVLHFLYGGVNVAYKSIHTLLKKTFI